MGLVIESGGWPETGALPDFLNPFVTPSMLKFGM
jgi:hypothetical protein